MAVLGKLRRLPGSLSGDSEVGAHELALEETPEGIEFRRKLETRERARKSFIQADNEESHRRAILRRPRPHRGVWIPGTWVMYFRQVSNIKGYVGKWNGPAKVTLQEDNKVVWLSHAGHLIRCSPQHLRMATLRETNNMPVMETKPETPGQIPTPTDIVAESTAFIDLTETPPPPPENQNLETRSDQGPENKPETELNPQPDETRDQENQDLKIDASQIPIPDADKEDIEFGDHLEPEEIHHVEEDQGYTFEFSIHEKDINRWKEDGKEDWSFLVTAAKRDRAEVKIKDLTMNELKQFDKAKRNEIGAWLDTKTVRRRLRGQLSERRIMRTKLFLSWKKSEDGTGEGEASGIGISGPGHRHSGE